VPKNISLLHTFTELEVKLQMIGWHRIPTGKKGGKGWVGGFDLESMAGRSAMSVRISKGGLIGLAGHKRKFGNKMQLIFGENCIPD